MVHLRKTETLLDWGHLQGKNIFFAVGYASEVPLVNEGKAGAFMFYHRDTLNFQS